MSKIHSNMRLMEFLVEYVHSSSASECLTAEDETCLTFTYLDYFQIRVKQSEYESSQYTKSKNCLFTTHDNKSSDENQVFKLFYNALFCITIVHSLDIRESLQNVFK